MKIIVQVKDIYGTRKIYPICDKALIFAELLNQKTFTKQDASLIKKLGYEFEISTPTITL
jgi:hypothetical protein